mgnify:CR=1 FL=1
MNKLTKKQLLIGGLILLFVINIAALGTIIYQNQKYNNVIQSSTDTKREWRDERHRDRDRGRRDHDKPHKHDYPNRFDRYLKQELDLNDDQFSEFLEIREDNKEKQHAIVKKLSEKRSELMNELSSETPDTTKLQEISQEIGGLHKKLKETTIEHFMRLKTICSPVQKEKLNDMIQRMENHRSHMEEKRPYQRPHSKHRPDCMNE